MSSRIEASAASLTVAGFPFATLLGLFAPCAARLGLRKSPPSFPTFLPSPSVTSESEVGSALLSFLLPRVPKNDERRLSLASSGMTNVGVGGVALFRGSALSTTAVEGAGAPSPAAVGVPWAMTGCSTCFTASSSAFSSFFP